MKKIIILTTTLLFLAQVGLAEQSTKTSVKRGYNHTEIVIHNNSPEANEARRQQVQRAQQRRDEKIRRKHELELAKIRSGSNGDIVRARKVSRAPAPAPVYRKKEYRPAPFMNGGYPTMGFGSYGYGGFGGFAGFSTGYGYGYGNAPRYGYRGGYRGRAYRGRGSRGQAYRGRSSRGRGYRGRGSRGRCR